jgi:hypothetical protein
MSFEESDIPEVQKYELMAEFEKTFFAGLDNEQFNILWVEHTDKGRLELNCIIPKIELSTGKAFNPYFHGSDLHLKDLFTKSMNLKYGFTDPQDPLKSASVTGSKKQIGLFKDYEALDKKLKQLVTDGMIQDRSEMIDLLKENGIEVTREGEDYISVKLPESKKARRLNGGIYKKQFTSIDELGDIRADIAQRERAFAGRDREVEHGDIVQRLSDAVAKRAEYNAARYAEPKKRKRRAQETSNERARNTRELRRIDTGSGQERQNETPKIRKKIPMGLDQGELNDRIRSTITRYVESRKARSRTRTRRSSERAERASVYASIDRTTAATDYRTFTEAHRERQLRNDVAASIKRLSSVFDRVINKITESFKELAKQIDQELFSKTHGLSNDEEQQKSELFTSRSSHKRF